MKLQILHIPCKINELESSCHPGISIALSYTIDSFSLIADKAKPRVIVGRKATGPDGIAGLPKQDQRDRIPAAFLSAGIRFLIIR